MTTYLPHPRKHLKLIGHVDIAWFLPALTEHRERFGDSTWRQDHPQSPHGATRTIYLRMPQEITLDSVLESLEVVDQPALLQVYPFAKLASSMAAELDAGDRVARVMLIELAPRSRIAEHRDEGGYAEATERYHLPITTNPDCIVHINGEFAHLEPGDVWWFDKHSPHSVVNMGREPRVHMVMDLFRP